jgi:adenylosuccinate synthase
MNKQIDIVVDTSYGDTAKARIIDLISNQYDVNCRITSGPNSGRTVYYNNKKIVFSQIPSGALHKNMQLIIGSNCVINLDLLEKEIQNLESLGISIRDRLFISDKAHLIQQKHIDQDIENEKTEYAIGSTKQGIGPCYTDKIRRRGLQIGNVKHMLTFKSMICDTSDLIHKFLKEGKKILCESAQGTFLDIDHGTYPHVTSTNVLSGTACNSLGFGPCLVNKVIGITKAYTTRVGLGDFITELPTDSGSGKIIAENGHEFGSITGRPRRIGWLNLVELKKAIQLNGCSEIILTKLDVLSALDEIKICTKYVNNQPFYETFPGWKSDVSQAKKWWDLPDEAVSYINFIEDQIETKITMVSVGPERDQIIRKY